MYLSHFALNEAPFSIAPDPRYLYMSQRHQEALAHLLYGLKSDGGFVLLTGEIGAGKTTVCRCLLEQIPDSCDVAYIFNPKLTVVELLETLCSEFHIEVTPGVASVKQLVDAINVFLLAGHAKGRHAVLIIDEAQNLSADVLEQMRLLTNLETHQRKLLQIVLIGQPELATLLMQPELKQLAQRVVARYHLGPLTQSELASYIQHRLAVAGCNKSLFAKRLIAHIHQLSGGTPRVVNLLCDRALLGAYVEGKSAPDMATLKQAAQEVFPVQGRLASPSRLRYWLVATTGLLVVAGLAWWGYRPNHSVIEAPALVAIPRPLPALAPLPAWPALTPIPPVLLGSTDAIVWPADLPREPSKDAAFAALFKAWELSYTPGKFCRASRELRCRSATGSIDELKNINRPAVLYLSEPDGATSFVTLVGLDQQEASIAIADRLQTVSLDSLLASWDGRYTLLWRAPPADIDKLRPGQRGPAAAWLVGQLAKANGQKPKAAAVFDFAIQQQLKAFQTANGLSPSGLPTIPTLVRLSLVGDNAAPTLLREKR